MKRWSLWAAGLAVLAAGAGLVWQAHANRQQAARLAQLTSENARLRARADALARHATAAVPPAGAAAEASPSLPAPKPGINPEDVIALQRLKLSLADANSTIARLQSRMDEAEAKIQNLTVDNRRLSGSETELTQNLAAANQAVDALQKELKSRSDRVTQIEIAYQKLRDQSGTDAQKLAQLQQLAAELQGIYQRREVYSNSILRRYKQINEQYRSMSGVMQAQRTDAPATGGADLARIQDSIAMAEEDLRQLDGLNAQALRIQKKMAGK